MSKQVKGSSFVTHLSALFLIVVQEIENLDSVVQNIVWHLNFSEIVEGTALQLFVLMSIVTQNVIVTSDLRQQQVNEFRLARIIYRTVRLAP